MTSMEDLKRLRETTGAGVMDAKKALDEANGDYKRAQEILLEKSADKVAKRAERVAAEGVIASYVHTGGKVASLVHLSCETDFVAKTDDFKNLAQELAKQVCAIKYTSVEEVLADTYIKDTSLKVSDMINQAVAKMGEKIELVKFIRYAVKEADE
jgi:elongation factor Ts